MSRHSVSLLIAGISVGALLATLGFALLTRNQNSSRRSELKSTVLRLGHSLDQNHPVHLAMMRMATILQEKSSGSLELQIYPNSQLGSETELIEQLQRGVLAMAKTSVAPMESFVPEIAVFGVPYAFRDHEHFWNVLAGDVGIELLSAGKHQGLQGLCYYDAGARSFYSIDRPILKPADLHGLKVRVQKSKTAMDMVEALGASPTPIPYGELYTALQQKMVDGAENNLPSFFNSRHFEVCRHYSLDEHTRVPDILLISESVWSDLSLLEREWLQEAADKSAHYQRCLWEEETRRVLQLLKTEGVKIHYPNQQAFVKKVETMHREHDGTYIGKLLQRIRNE